MAADKEELFDLVDEQDRVVGTELRSVVHAKGVTSEQVDRGMLRPVARCHQPAATCRLLHAATCRHQHPALFDSSTL